MPALALFNSGRLVRTFNLDQDEIVIGRLSGLDIELPVPTVSRKHARIVKEKDRYLLVDNGSVNGVLVNDVKVDRCYLRVGDRIQIEEFEILFEPKELSYAFPDKIEDRSSVGTGGKDATQPSSTKSVLDMTFLNIGDILKEDDP